MKKSLLSVLVLLSMLIGITGYAFSSVPELPVSNPSKLLFDENFEDSAVNEVAANGPYIGYIGLEKDLVYRAFESIDGSIAYKINNKSTATTAQTSLYPTGVANKKYVYQYDFKSAESNSRKMLAYTRGTANAYIVELKDNGNFGLGNGADTLIPYLTNNWYTLYVTYDLTTTTNNVKIIIKDRVSGAIVLDKVTAFAQSSITFLNTFLYAPPAGSESTLWIDNMKFYEYENYAYVEDFDDGAVVTSNTLNPYWSLFATETNGAYRSFEAIDTGSSDKVYKINNKSTTNVSPQTSIMINNAANKKYLLEYDFKASDNTTRKLMPYTLNTSSSKNYVFEVSANGKFCIQNGTDTGVPYNANTWYKVKILYDLTATAGNNVKITVIEKATDNVVLNIGASYMQTAITQMNFYVYPTSPTYSDTSLYLNNISFKEYMESPIPADTYIDNTVGDIRFPQISSVGETNVLFNYNFSAGLPNVTADTNGVSWQYTNLANATADTVRTPSRGVTFTNVTNSSNNTAQSKIFFTNPLTGRYVYEADYMALDTNGVKDLFDVQNISAQNGQRTVAFTEGGIIEAGNSVVQDVTYEANKWYKLYVIMNLNSVQNGACSYQVILYDTTTGSIVFEKGFENQLGPVDLVTLTSFKTEQGSNGFYMDNAKLYKLGDYMQSEYGLGATFNIVDATVTANVALENKAYIKKDAVLIAGLYKNVNGTNSLQGLITESVMVNGSDTLEKQFIFENVTDAANCTIKIFAWNSLADTKPLVTNVTSN